MATGTPAHGRYVGRMTVLVTGGQSTSSAWVFEIVSKILRSRGPLVNMAGLRRELQRELRHPDGSDIELSFVRGCDTENLHFQITVRDRAAGATFNQHSQLALPHAAVTRNIRALASHDPLGLYLDSPSGAQLGPIIFTHRNPIDQVASYVRLYGLTRERLAQMESAEENSEILYDAATNSKNYRVLVEDLKQSLLWKRGALFFIRKGYLDALDARDRGVGVHAFRFTDITIDKERETIQELADIMRAAARDSGDHASWPVDVDAIFAEMQANKVHGTAGFHKNRRKVDFGRAFFGAEMTELLLDYFGDTMVAFGYWSESEWRSRLHPETIDKLVHVGQRPRQELQTRNMAARLLGPLDERTLALHELHGEKLDNALIFVDDRAGYLAVDRHLRDHPCPARIHPLYKALYGYPAPVFLLDEARCIHQHDLAQHIESIAFIRYADSTRKDCFDPLREAMADHQRIVTMRTIEVCQGDEKRLRTEIGDETAILCTNDPAQVQRLAVNLPREVKKVAIIPVYRYAKPPLIAS